MSKTNITTIKFKSNSVVEINNVINELEKIKISLSSFSFDDLTIRTKKALDSAGITRLDVLVNCTEQDLVNIENLGRKSINEIKQELDDSGLSLKSKPYKSKNKF